ncbi:MAG: hypothetical protein KJP09_10270 [Bacteroidia bacterium]|nr:hypothetical protein [Bacteroidia bacterium]MBT8309113.1 hypothetical protein [Bacteroidia bacterium]NND11107.1 hypothetical protein [Flavobacteriaceae bacterium]NNK28642.1 hypothetical protein [Flavobacteriaceae bacterium]RZV63110.1 MAG: hypothetical protein EX254_07170 [Flavobacteriaceae bacterium]
MIKREVIIGLIVGILANLLGVFLYLTFFSDEGFMESLRIAKANDFLGKIISIGAILNLVAFFIFIRNKQDYRARGVLLATVLIALGTFLIKFI